MMIQLRRLWAITQKELRQLARDRLTFGVITVMLPLLWRRVECIEMSMETR